MADEELPKIQVKGIAADISKLRAGFQEMRNALADFHKARGGLHKDVEDPTEQVTQLRQDLRFELEQLGNSGTNYDPRFDEHSGDGKDHDPLKSDSVERPAESEK